MSSVTPEAFRTHFPMLRQTVHLASCSLGAHSTELGQALARMQEDMVAGGAPWHEFEHQVDEARDRIATLIGARPDQIALMPSASVGAYQVASTRSWQARPRIVTTTAEFPSIAHVWLAQQPAGAEVVYAGLTAESFAALIDRTTRLVSLPLIKFQDSARLPVAEVTRAAHEAGAEVIADAYQALGTEPVDVNELDCDFLIGGTQKYLLGLPGLAFLYAREPERADRLPSLTGWFGRVNPFAFDPQQLDFPASASRFQTGTAAIPACYAASAGLRLIANLDLNTVREHVVHLGELAAERLAAQGERMLALPAAARGAHIVLFDDDAAGLGARLAKRGIATSPRGDSVLRVCFHYYNNTDDIDALCAALRDDRRTTRRPPAAATAQS